MIRGRSIATFAFALGIAVIAGFIGVVVSGSIALSELKVGGPVYEKIVSGKDLIADILPPPEYIIEPYLEATLVYHEPQSLAQRKARLAALRKDFDDRHAYWLKATGYDGGILKTLTEQSYKPAMEFWSAVGDRLLPALAKGDQAGADAAYKAAAQAYAAHRKVIDAIVEAANAENAAIEAAAAERETTLQWIKGSVAAVVLLLIAASVFGVLRELVRPVKVMTVVMGRLAEGELAVDIPYADRRDEIGAMATSVVRFKQNAIDNAALREQQDKMRAAADEQRHAALSGMANTVETESRSAVDQIATRVQGMVTNAESMAGAAIRVGASSQEVAAAARQVLSNAETVAAATEELSASIGEIAQQVNQASTVSQNSLADNAATQETIASLASAVDRIGDVASLINGIAAQTNLLALNATIEAARAGEAGKGFAVVAQEVKSLANQTAKATEDIAQQIAAVRSATDGAVSNVSVMGRRIEEIAEAAGSIAAAIEQQGAATREIAVSVNQTAEAARQVSGFISAVSSEANASGEAAADVRNNAKGVAESIAELRATIVRIVRTSTDDADRRKSERKRLDRPGTLTLDGRSEPVTVRDLSLHGAMLSLVEGVRVGQRCRLAVDGIGATLEAEIVSAERGTHLRFALDGAGARSLTGFLAGFPRVA